jgi:hypothetical protein
MLTDIVSLSTIAVAIIALTALYFTRAQLKVLGDQVAQASQATIVQTYSSISSATAEFNKTFLENPKWYQFFYEGQKADDEEIALRDELGHVCEIFMDYVDVVIELRNSAPFSAVDWSTWESWFRCIYNNSPVLREWVLDNIPFYPDYEFAIFGFIVMRDPLSGVIVEKWHIFEFDENDESHKMAAQKIWAEGWRSSVPTDGYPWVRTWVMGRIEDKEPALIATVEITRSDQAEVTVHWLLAVDNAHDPELLYSWIAGTLSGSKLIASVIIKKCLMLQVEGEIFYRIRKASRRRDFIVFPNRHVISREPFLVPKYRPIGGRYSRHRRSESYELR